MKKVTSEQVHIGQLNLATTEIPPDHWIIEEELKKRQERQRLPLYPPEYDMPYEHISNREKDTELVPPQVIIIEI